MSRSGRRHGWMETEAAAEQWRVTKYPETLVILIEA